MAKLFEEKIMEHLNDLDMQKSQFQVNIAYIEKPDGIVNIDGKLYKLTENGIDNIEFLIAPNVGEELKPLRKIVSGGEMSRIVRYRSSALRRNSSSDSPLLWNSRYTSVSGEVCEAKRTESPYFPEPGRLLKGHCSRIELSSVM